MRLTAALLMLTLTLPGCTALKALEGSDILDWGALMAACTIVVVPSILFFCFIQNRISGGLSEGAVK